MTTLYTLIDREILAPNVTRVNQWWNAGDDQDAAYGSLVAEIANHPDRYGPDGTHRLVLLAGVKR